MLPAEIRLCLSTWMCLKIGIDRVTRRASVFWETHGGRSWCSTEYQKRIMSSSPASGLSPYLYSSGADMELFMVYPFERGMV
jgi:hypothetical protein